MYRQHVGLQSCPYHLFVWYSTGRISQSRSRVPHQALLSDPELDSTVSIKPHQYARGLPTPVAVVSMFRYRLFLGRSSASLPSRYRILNPS